MTDTLAKTLERLLHGEHEAGSDPDYSDLDEACGNAYRQGLLVPATQSPDYVRGGDIAWEATEYGLVRFVTDERYQKFNAKIKRWYRPYFCSRCATPPTPADPVREAETTGIWPDFIAPPKYENPDPRWIDPALPDFRKIWQISRDCGYAIGLHGSMKRDCDMIAMPWTDDAVSAHELIDRIMAGMNAFMCGGLEHNPVEKPHGRLAWALQISDAYTKVMDISVCPRALAGDADKGGV